MPTLDDLLRRLTAPSAPELERRLEDGRIQCLACGHRCRIAEGHPGVCRVRYVEEGVLRRPRGYVGALACDPIEKKPFFHAFPGRDALTFGMLGCDLRCSYCFPGDTMVVTDRGPMTLGDAFAAAGRIERTEDAEIAYPDSLRAIARSGKLRRIRKLFKHSYTGPLVVLKPYYLPGLRCTPDHRVYATLDRERPPEPIEARFLTEKHYLAIPRRFELSGGEAVDVMVELRDIRPTHRVLWKLPPSTRQMIAEATANGQTSRSIGAALGKSASYIRHVRSKLARGLAGDSRASCAILEAGTVRFSREHKPGIPAAIPLDQDFAALLGYYCAEGCVTRSPKRPNSLALSFSFSPTESHLVTRVVDLLRRCFKVEAGTVRRTTTLAVSVSKASACHLLGSLAGRGARMKRVPTALFQAPPGVLRSFLDAYVEGDGHRYPGGKVSITTVSRQLAYGVAWAALKLGHIPSLYIQEIAPEGTVQGRKVERSPYQYVVVWYEKSSIARRVLETEDNYLIPIRGMRIESYSGDVYNMAVEDEHNYLAGFLLVSNCQNWETSQVLRDDDAVAPPRPATAGALVDAAIANGAPVIASSYNEPLITADWASEVFREARARGLTCAFISNGNGTPEVLEYLRPLVDLYKVDLKGFTEKAYRDLGAKLSNVLDTIPRLKKLGFWVEIVTLLIPGWNDDPGEIRDMARFLAGVDPFMPWHVTAFHPDYKMVDRDRTPVRLLLDAHDAGKAAGLRYVYPGNAAGRVGDREDTRCHSCSALLIRRRGFLVLENRMRGSSCPGCGEAIPGVWEADPPRRTEGSGTPKPVRLPAP